MSEEAEIELQRLKIMSARTPVWLKCIWTGIALLFEVLTLSLCIIYCVRLIALDGAGSGDVKRLLGSLIGLCVSSLLLAVSRDLWMLPKIIDGKAKTWML
jgi:hypothetical protein